MQEIKFMYRGSASKPYVIRIVKSSEDELSAFCNCEAASQGMHCKHRIGILFGDKSKLVKPNDDDLTLVQTWLVGTRLELALTNLRDLEAEEARLKIAVSDAKKHLAKVMGKP